MASQDGVSLAGDGVSLTPGSGGGGGTVTQVVVQGGPFLASGTVTTAGTIDNSVSSLTAHGVVLGEGTSAVAVTGAATNGQLLIGQTGADPAWATASGDATINSTGSITVSKIGGATPATAANTGAVLNSGTVQINNSTTVSPAAGSTTTLSPTTGTTDVQVNMPATGGTITLAYAGGFARQRMEIDIVQGATAGAVVLNSGTVNGFVGPLVSSYTITNSPGSIDMLICISPAVAYTRVCGVSPNFPH